MSGKLFYMQNLSKKNIAIIIPDFDFGGEEKRAVFFANNYADYFNKVILVSPEGKSMPLLDKRVSHIPLQLRNMLNVPKVLSILKNEKIDYLQGHKRITMPYLFAAEKFLKLVSVFNFDNIYPKYNGVCKFITPSNILYLSDVLKDFYSPYYPGKNNITINMGGDFFEETSAEEKEDLRKSLGIKDQTILLSLGRLSYQKNHKALIDALSQIKDQNFICLVAGSGPLEEELKKQVVANGLEDKVVFLGHRTDIKQLLGIADILVQSSHFEGFPNVFIEAASVGLPIVATNVGSSKTLVQKNGILVKPDDIEELARGIRTVILNYTNYKAGANSLKESDYFQQFHKLQMLKGYISFYETVN